MKKLNFMIIAVLAFSFSFMTSCKKDDADLTPPTITVSVVGTPDYYAGDIIQYSIVLGTSNGDLTTLTAAGTGSTHPATPGSGVNSTLPEAAWNAETSTFVKNTVSVTVLYDIKLGGDLDEGDSFDVVFTVTDEENQTNTATVTITIGASTTPITMQTYTGKVFSYTSTDLSTTNILNAADGVLLTGSGTVADLDLVYAHNGDAARLNSICSPNSSWLASCWSQSAWSATGKNATAVDEYSGDFDALNATSIGEISAPTGADVHQLAVNDMVKFVTADGYSGVLKVTNISNAKVNRTLTADIKIINPAAETK